MNRDPNMTQPAQQFLSKPSMIEHDSSLVYIEASHRVLGHYARWGKRVFDVVASVFLLILLAPLLLLVGLMIRVSPIGGPSIFRQKRVGRWGRPFTMVKYRTMKTDRREQYLEAEGYAGHERRQTHKTDDDPRHTSVGRLLRKTSIDELPQLWNVLKGEMSIVGPRPEILEVARRHGIVDHPRHLVRPGITGLWQISELRSQLLHENVHIDLDYVARVTLLGDVRIILKTFTSVFSNAGA
ncbi:MAG: sugar transferase [Acidimicrobiales bacterium]